MNKNLKKLKRVIITSTVCLAFSGLIIGCSNKAKTNEEERLAVPSVTVSVTEAVGVATEGSVKVTESADAVITKDAESSNSQLTEAPTEAVTEEPTLIVTEKPTNTPTPVATKTPTKAPTKAPTKTPTAVITKKPTSVPTPVVTATSTPTPTVFQGWYVEVETPDGVTLIPLCTATPVPTLQCNHTSIEYCKREYIVTEEAHWEIVEEPWSEEVFVKVYECDCGYQAESSYSIKEHSNGNCTESPNGYNSWISYDKYLYTNHYEVGDEAWVKEKKFKCIDTWGWICNGCGYYCGYETIVQRKYELE